jgi:hypothetical protein
MTALAPNMDSARRLAELEAQTRVAWREYRDGLHDLSASEYTEREPAEWDQLQATLRELEAERARVANG